MKLTGAHGAAAVMMLAALAVVLFGDTLLQTIGWVVVVIVVMVVLVDLISPSANLLRSRWRWPNR
jgi:hypothetical protein